MPLTKFFALSRALFNKNNFELDTQKNFVPMKEIQAVKKIIQGFLFAVVLGITFYTSKVLAADAPILNSETARQSYAIGVDIARNFKRLGISMDLDVFMKAFRDAYSGEKLLMSEHDLRTVMNAYQSQLLNRQAEMTRIAAEVNKKAGEDFLAANKQKEGVVTLESGLQYKILKKGEGIKPVDGDIIKCNYRGTLLNGKEFDSSYDGGAPVYFAIDMVIPGWQQALKLMPVGSKWEIFVPSHLAYGATGAGRDIGPNQTLIFEIELLATNNPNKQADKQ